MRPLRDRARLLHGGELTARATIARRAALAALPAAFAVAALPAALALAALPGAGCRKEPTTAELWQKALAAPTLAEGIALCHQGPPGLRAECVAVVADAHATLDRSVCDGLPGGVWHDECIFQYAERAAKAGQLPDAIAACNDTRFGRECSFHLLRDAAEAMWEDPMEKVTAFVKTWPSMDRAPDAGRLFWRTWHRKRLVERLPVDPTGCPNDDCLLGARDVIYQSLNGVAKARGADFCLNPPFDGWVGEREMWAYNDTTHAWFQEWATTECMRREHVGDKPTPP